MVKGCEEGYFHFMSLPETYQKEIKKNGKKSTVVDLKLVIVQPTPKYLSNNSDIWITSSEGH